MRELVGAVLVDLRGLEGVLESEDPAEGRRDDRERVAIADEKPGTAIRPGLARLDDRAHRFDRVLDLLDLERVPLEDAVLLDPVEDRVGRGDGGSAAIPRNCGTDPRRDLLKGRVELSERDQLVHLLDRGFRPGVAAFETFHRAVHDRPPEKK